MNDISGFGLSVQINASVTFPSGFNVTQFADDSDPFDLPSLQIMDKAMGLNGDLVTWSVAQPINVTINVIPDSEDDRNLSILLSANRVGRGKQSARDEISMTGIYPDGSTVALTPGKITDGMPSSGVASSGRKKTKTYSFTFEGLNVTRGAAV
jgi:hypothetical protein